MLDASSFRLEMTDVSIHSRFNSFTEKAVLWTPRLLSRISKWDVPRASFLRTVHYKVRVIVRGSRSISAFYETFMFLKANDDSQLLWQTDMALRRCRLTTKQVTYVYRMAQPTKLMDWHLWMHFWLSPRMLRDGTIVSQWRSRTSGCMVSRF